ncbi:hypothetical protein HXX76_007128 [Chlamydomonas incerta]|uniref:Sugar fermentation stimulation protein C-terminal domain-containing protein n=1 Tax=Chlamydomonas incerta TaxID=51695 RepID=A0A835T4K0_CHLIN|nr:hypothetical protein HXX76_007128 [Chlamydomonas incerta]|eukprot:KAG2435933.1 hypothetical protein HXX76_007128 [Chlamydomonas incerta]
MIIASDGQQQRPAADAQQAPAGAGAAEAAAGSHAGAQRKRGRTARAAEDAAAGDAVGRAAIEHEPAPGGRPTRRAKLAAASAIAATAVKEASARRTRGAAAAAAAVKEDVGEDVGDEAEDQEEGQPKALARSRARAAPRKKAPKRQPLEDGAAEPEEVAAEPAATPAKAPAAKRGRAGGAGKAAGPKSPGKAAAAVQLLDEAEAAALAATPLLDLGQLVAGKLVRRPSASVKTPYVADIQLLPAAHPGGEAAASSAAGAAGEGGGSEGDMVLAHAPAMDCAGMVTPGATVYMSKSAPRAPGAPPAATSHAIQLVEDQRPGGTAAVVGYHPQLAERLAAELVRRRLLEAALGAGRVVGLESQRTFGNTRVDYVLKMEDGSRMLLEVKNVVCADFPDVAGGVPPGRPAVGVYKVPVPSGRLEHYSPTALFPHGAQKPKIKVVSDRAIKHVTELTALHKHGRELPEAGSVPHEGDEGAGGGKGEPEGGEGRLRCAVLFLVNRSDCAAFRPCHEADPLFAQVLKAAEEAGVKLVAYDVVWRGGAAFAGRHLPVVFGPGVTSAYDPARLAEVLHFNATDPRKNWKSTKAKAAAAEVKAVVASGKAAKSARRGGKKAKQEEESSSNDQDSE